MSPVLFILAAFFILGVLSLLTAILLRRLLKVPQGTVRYADTEEHPGDILRSRSISLVGKPDYILERNGEHIAVEVKTGKTPQNPYANHIAQLFAYCHLLEEKYARRPSYGIIRYPEREIQLEYPENAEAGLQTTINEMMDKKESGNLRSELAHICRKCREGNHS